MFDAKIKEVKQKQQNLDYSRLCDVSTGSCLVFILSLHITMCNKTLAKIIHQSYSNGSSIQFYKYLHVPILSTKTFDFSNLTPLQGSSTKAVPRPRSSNYVFSKSCLLSYIGGNESKIQLDKSCLITPLTMSRLYCTHKQPKLPKIMDFPQVIWPSVFKTIRNWILSNFIIMRYFDNEFNLPDFVTGSKQVSLDLNSWFFES